MTSTPWSSSARICPYRSRASDCGSLQLPQRSTVTSTPLHGPLFWQQHSHAMFAGLALQHAVEFALALHQHHPRARRIMTDSKAGRFQRLRRHFVGTFALGHHHIAKHIANLLGGNASGTIDDRRIGGGIEHSRLHADVARRLHPAWRRCGLRGRPERARRWWDWCVRSGWRWAQPPALRRRQSGPAPRDARADAAPPFRGRQCRHRESLHCAAAAWSAGRARRLRPDVRPPPARPMSARAPPATSATWTITGSQCGRCLAAKIFSTAAASSALAPSP